MKFSSDFDDVIVPKLSRVNKLTEKSLRQAWFKVGADLKTKANKEILRKPKSGRVYMIRTRSGKRIHRASPPGDYHANRSGKLRRSLGWKVRGRDLYFGYGLTRPAPDYDDFVELGTSKMAARPSLGNTVDDTRKNVEQHLTNALYNEFTP